MKTYSINVENSKSKNREIIGFDVAGIIKNEGSLAEADFYLSQFKSSEAFLTYLLKEGKISVGNYKCFLLENSIDKKDAIFNDAFIHEKSGEAIKTDKQLKDDPRIAELADKMIEIMINDENAERTMAYNKNFPKGVLDSLKLIVNAKKANNLNGYQNYRQNLITELKSYSSLRDAHVWLEKYNSKKEEKVEEQYEQMSFVPQPQPDNHYRELAELAREKARELQLRLVEISNPNIDFYFNEGGLASVIENCSLDEILALPPEEQEFIGFASNNRPRR